MRSHLQEGAGLVPLAFLVEVLDALVDDELPVFALGDAHPFERPGGRPLEVDTAVVEAASVARTLELVLRRQPARGAAEVCALREDGVDALRFADDPHPLVLLELGAHLTDGEVAREARLER